MTLAEVVIVLGIVGVIAAFTVPNLIGNYQKARTAIQLKKVYSSLAQAVKESEVDNGPNQYWDWGAFGDVASIRKSFDTNWAPYLNVMKICSTYSDCSYLNMRPWLFANKTPSVIWAVHPATRTAFLLRDGSFIIIKNYDSNGPLEKWIYVDLNASKKPNILGKDVFHFVLDQNMGLMPYGYNKQV